MTLYVSSVMAVTAAPVSSLNWTYFTSRETVAVQVDFWLPDTMSRKAISSRSSMLSSRLSKLAFFRFLKN